MVGGLTPICTTYTTTHGLVNNRIEGAFRLGDKPLAHNLKQKQGSPTLYPVDQVELARFADRDRRTCADLLAQLVPNAQRSRIESIAIAPDGTVWFGAWEGGISRLVGKCGAGGQTTPRVRGKRPIVFTVSRDGDHQIYAMNADGSRLINLTHHPAPNWTPAWSPDGTRIAFASGFTRDDMQIYVMDTDGVVKGRLTNQYWNAYPAWSPDGKRIAYISMREEKMWLYVMNADGSNVRRLIDTPISARRPAWSPDGKRIAFTSGSTIYEIDADGGNLATLIDNAADGPTWSPDGSKIAFASNLGGGRPEIYVVNKDGTDLTRLTDNSANDYSPSWSPDGKKIVFNEDGQIYVMNADGSGQTRLTYHPTWNDEDPVWSP
jgi:Tol biopolymer transport system component